MQFIAAWPPMRVLFGRGTLSQLAEEAARLGMRRALVLSTANQSAQADLARRALGEAASGVFNGARMHTPVEVTEEALALAGRIAADGIVSIGGGSTTGLGKAIVRRAGLPHLAIPTTYAGSEMTSILGETSGGEKRTIRDPKVLPNTVIYDVDLTLGLPVRMSGASGLNAIAHAVEASYARDADPLVGLMAEEAVRALAIGLAGVRRSASDVEAREQALYGAWLCGSCLERTTMSLHHKVCHVLGGTFDLPHAETHAIVLPHALAYNAPAAPETIARLTRSLASEHPAKALFDLNQAFGNPSGLRELGMPHDELDRVLGLLLQDPYWNPRPLERAGLKVLLADAWAGMPPGTSA